MKARREAEQKYAQVQAGIAKFSGGLTVSTFLRSSLGDDATKVLLPRLFFIFDSPDSWVYFIVFRTDYTRVFASDSSCECTVGSA